jgi:hypothetical protein
MSLFHSLDGTEKKAVGIARVTGATLLMGLRGDFLRNILSNTLQLLEAVFFSFSGVINVARQDGRERVSRQCHQFFTLFQVDSQGFQEDLDQFPDGSIVGVDLTQRLQKLVMKLRHSDSDMLSRMRFQVALLHFVEARFNGLGRQDGPYVMTFDKHLHSQIQHISTSSLEFICESHFVCKAVGGWQSKRVSRQQQTMLRERRSDCINSKSNVVARH